MEQLRNLNANALQRERVFEFLKVARLLIQHRGSSADALASVGGQEAPPRVREILKAAISGGTLANATWAAALAPYAVASAAFSESLRQSSVFDHMLANGMRRAPLRTSGVIVLTGAIGVGAAENNIKPISQLVVGAALVEPVKATAIIVVSAEVAKLQNAAAAELFNTELTSAVAAATDSVFLAALYADTTPGTSAGSTAANVLTDLGVLLGAVTVNARSRLYWIMSPARARAYALLPAARGGGDAVSAINGDRRTSARGRRDTGERCGDGGEREHHGRRAGAGR